MDIRTETVICSDRNIGKFLDTTWDTSDLDTVLFENDEPVGRIIGWEKDDDGKHVFHVLPHGAEKPQAYTTKPADGNMGMRFRFVIFEGISQLAVDLVA